MYSKILDTLQVMVDSIVSEGISPPKEEVIRFFEENEVDLDKIISLIKAFTVSPLLVQRAGFTEMKDWLDSDIQDDNNKDIRVPNQVAYTKVAYALECIKNKDYKFMDNDSIKESIILITFGYYSDLDFESKGKRTEDYIESDMYNTIHFEEEASKPQVFHKDGKRLYVEDNKIKVEKISEPHDEILEPEVLPNQVFGTYGYIYKYMNNVYQALFNKFNSKEEAREYIYSTF